MSVVLDFFIKSTGTGEMNLSWLSRLPILPDTCDPRLRAALRLRTLCLSCLTSSYADLWLETCSTDLQGDFGAPTLADFTLPIQSKDGIRTNSSAERGYRYIDAFRTDRWAKSDSRLPQDYFVGFTPEWHRDVALRTDYARRQAL